MRLTLLFDFERKNTISIGQNFVRLKTCDWRKLGVNRLSVEPKKQANIIQSNVPNAPSVFDAFDALFCVLFLEEFDVNVANHVLADVVAHIHLLNLAVFFLDLVKNLLEELEFAPQICKIALKKLTSSKYFCSSSLICPTYKFLFAF